MKSRHEDLLGSSMKICETEEGLILGVSVKPKSREFKIMVEGGEVVVYCRSEPAKGKVNRELIKEFSRLFHRKVELVSGFTSKRKRLLIREVEKNQVEAVLHAASFSTDHEV
jgi:uncharacterized protein (TIGR00251 family)